MAKARLFFAPGTAKVRSPPDQEEHCEAARPSYWSRPHGDHGGANGARARGAFN